MNVHFVLIAMLFKKKKRKKEAYIKNHNVTYFNNPTTFKCKNLTIVPKL